ncbi:LysR family transcriptional regulator [Aliisedimentitalea scapharcae]|uniref:LysR family transcriptional regulator n=1 Tax=Aliisedimentitalea scapharcae TaxID=1524259 RepID=A0ABZ2XU19_9RHOB
MIDYSLRQLEYFAATARMGSISDAARAMGVSSAAVASAIGKLEELCQLTLFDRFPAQGVRLTPVGVRFLVEAEQVLGQAQSLRTTARALSEQTSGHVRFGCYFVLAYVFGPVLLGAHKDRWPHVTVEVLENHGAGMVAQLERREVDLILTYEAGVPLDRCDVQRVAQVAPRVVLPAAHPLARRDALELSDLEGIPYLQVKEPGMGPSYLDMLQAAGLTPDVALVSRSYEMVRSCVGKGLGFTLMAFQPPNRHSYHGDAVVSVPLREPLGVLQIVLAAQKGEMDTPVVRNFADLCREVLTTG